MVNTRVFPKVMYPVAFGKVIHSKVLEMTGSSTTTLLHYFPFDWIQDFSLKKILQTGLEKKKLQCYSFMSTWLKVEYQQ